MILYKWPTWCTNSFLEKNLYITLVIYQESLHDARSTKCKILHCKTSNTSIKIQEHQQEKNLCITLIVYQLYFFWFWHFPSMMHQSLGWFFGVTHLCYSEGRQGDRYTHLRKDSSSRPSIPQNEDVSLRNVYFLSVYCWTLIVTFLRSWEPRRQMASLMLNGWLL